MAMRISLACLLLSCSLAALPEIGFVESSLHVAEARASATDSLECMENGMLGIVWGERELDLLVQLECPTLDMRLGKSAS